MKLFDYIDKDKLKRLAIIMKEENAKFPLWNYDYILCGFDNAKLMLQKIINICNIRYDYFIRAKEHVFIASNSDNELACFIDFSNIFMKFRKYDLPPGMWDEWIEISGKYVARQLELLERKK